MGASTSNCSWSLWRLGMKLFRYVIHNFEYLPTSRYVNKGILKTIHVYNVWIRFLATGMNRTLLHISHPSNFSNNLPSVYLGIHMYRHLNLNPHPGWGRGSQIRTEGFWLSIMPGWKEGSFVAGAWAKNLTKNYTYSSNFGLGILA
jgi:hypothetical protein